MFIFFELKENKGLLSCVLSNFNMFRLLCLGFAMFSRVRFCVLMMWWVGVVGARDWLHLGVTSSGPDFNVIFEKTLPATGYT